jgi:hypothetical protein
MVRVREDWRLEKEAEGQGNRVKPIGTEKMRLWRRHKAINNTTEQRDG